MDFENNNRLYELAATDSELAGELENLYQLYGDKMHEYLLALALKYGVTLEEDIFNCSNDFEKNTYKQLRLRIVGLILGKKSDEKQKYTEFSRQLDESYAAEKITLARKYGINLSQAEAAALSLWTGIL